MRAVVILGAGASAGFGVPTLRQLFKEANARAYLAQNAHLRNTLQNLIWSPRGLNLEKSHMGLTVEDILTLMRDSERQEYGLPVVLSADELASFRKGLYVLIKRAIYNGKSSTKRSLNPLINFMRTNAQHTTWASFNWDCLFEASFWYSSAPPGEPRHNPQLAIDVAGWGGPAQHTHHTFLKLHGAINWWFENNRINYLRFGADPQLNEKWTAYENGATPGQPVILEPSHYKYAGEMYELLKPQWQRFAVALAEADLVFVVGYSLPEGDSEARSAVTLGFQANPGAAWIVVDPSEAVLGKYEQILGNQRLIQLPGTLEEWNDNLEPVIHTALTAA